MNARITVLMENYVPVSFGLTAEHGLSFLVEYGGRSYLFDTGQSGAALSNAFELGREIRGIESIILSHGHYDHTGGLPRFLQYLNGQTEIRLHEKALARKYVAGAGFGEKYIGLLQPAEYLEANYGAAFRFLEDFERIGEGIYTLANVPMNNRFESIPEALKVKSNGEYRKDELEDDLSLIMETERGLIVLLGCAHRGMVNICEEAKRRLSSGIYAVVGGTHTQAASEERLESIVEYVQDNGIAVFAPNHCTGFDTIAYFRKALPEIFSPAFCGSVIEL